jgi:hypothetical protein
MHIPRRLVVAGLTVLTVSTVSGAILPGQPGSTDPTSVERRAGREFAGNDDVVRASARANAETFADAVNSDELGSSELRPAEDAADGVIEALLRSR